MPRKASDHKVRPDKTSGEERTNQKLILKVGLFFSFLNLSTIFVDYLNWSCSAFNVLDVCGALQAGDLSTLAVQTDKYGYC